MTPLDEVPYPEGPYFTNGLFVWVRNPATCDGSQVAIEIRPVRYDEDVIPRAQWEALAELWAESPTMAALLEGFRRGGSDGCFCEVAIGNPNYSDHTAHCKEVSACLSRLGRGK